MVNTAQQRTADSVAKNSGEITYLRMKALLRHHVYELSKYETVKAMKDAAGKAMIDPYNLDARDKLNAWQAWRELYYRYFKKIQLVQKE